MKKVLKRLLQLFFLVAFAWVAIGFGPSLFARIFGGPDIQWISERFSEKLVEVNELVALEVTLTGQETASKNAWLVGKVQEVLIPYDYSVRFLVDLSQSEVRIVDDTVEVRLPSPRPDYGELTVNESEMKRKDWLYPLTPERFVAIEADIKLKLFNECASNPAYAESAWASAEKSIKALFSSVVAELYQDATMDIHVIQEEKAAA